MHVLFCHDTYYTKDKPGRVYAYGAFPYALWESRYLPHFDRVTVLGREKPFDARVIKSLDVSSGPRVEHALLPNINTPLRRLTQGRVVYEQIKALVEQADAVIIRGPVEFGMMAARAARVLGKPYAVELSGCAFENVWNHGSLTGKFYAPLKCLRARSMVRRADQVMYVTERFLQRTYPAGGYTDFASNVDIEAPPPAVLENRLERISPKPQKLVFGMIGNMGNELKGLEIALRALHSTKDALPHFELRILGQGDPSVWRDRIAQYGLSGQVVFSGTCKGGQNVLDWLDDIDIYLQPSLHEGLPRSLIEAMSRATPALASNAGGIPELLAPSFIHRKGDAKTLAVQILELASDAELRKQAARDNFEKAQAYTRDKLVPRRTAFWARFAALAAGTKPDVKKEAA